MRELSEDQKRDFEAHAFRTLRRASAAAQRRPEHRPDEPRRLLPQLPVELVPRRRQCRRRRALSKDESREIVYGMPYAEWQAKHQVEASDAKQGGVREEPAGRSLRPRPPCVGRDLDRA